MVVYDIESFNTIKCVSYANCIYRLSEISGQYNRDVTERENEKCRRGCIVFREVDNINEMLDYVLQFKGGAGRINNKIVKYTLYLFAHKGNGFIRYALSNREQLLV